MDFEDLKEALFIGGILLVVVLGIVLLMTIIPAGFALGEVIYDLIKEWGSTLCTTVN